MSDIDIYDANLEPQGSMERIQAHREGKWHKTFHCWIVSPRDGGKVLFQQRSATMRNFPGLLDVSAAGHLDSGESVEDGLREVREELGLALDIDDLAFLGQRVEVADQANGQRNREYQSVYMYVADVDLATISPDRGEVSALIWLPIQDGMRLFTDLVSSLELSGFTSEGHPPEWRPCMLSVTDASFLPRIQKYYLTSLIMAERLLLRSGPVAIS